MGGKRGKRQESISLALQIALVFSLVSSCDSLAAQDETYGTVTNVVDGDTFDVAVEKDDPRLISRVERVRLADVDSPEMKTKDGPPARDFTYSVLMNKRVYLDIDDLSATGRDNYGRLVCLVYLTGAYGQPLSAPSFNRLLVDSGHARLKNFTNNEFDPRDWWEEGALPSSDGLQDDLAGELKEELLPQIEESAEILLDRAARELWEWLKAQIGL